LTIDNDNDYDKGWLSSDEFAGNKAIRKKGNMEIGKTGEWVNNDKNKQ